MRSRKVYAEKIEKLKERHNLSQNYELFLLEKHLDQTIQGLPGYDDGLQEGPKYIHSSLNYTNSLD